VESGEGINDAPPFQILRFAQDDSERAHGSTGSP
jgi:hypothetical protein